MRDRKYGERESDMTYSKLMVHGLIQTLHLPATWNAAQTTKQAVCPRFIPFDRWSEPSSLKDRHIATGIAPVGQYFQPSCAYSSVELYPAKSNNTANQLNRAAIFLIKPSLPA